MNSVTRIRLAGLVTPKHALPAEALDGWAVLMLDLHCYKMPDPEVRRVLDLLRQGEVVRLRTATELAFKLAERLEYCGLKIDVLDTTVAAK